MFFYNLEDCYKERKEYYGTVNITESGRTCQEWSSQEPHKHIFHIHKTYWKYADANYCRNFDLQVKPWCFTIDKRVRWEYCNVTQCPKKSDYIQNGKWLKIL